MPTLQRFPSSQVVIYSDDHLPPHVHLRLGDGRECTIAIDSLEIRGRVAAREIRDALAWIVANRAVLHQEWERYNQ